MDLFCSVMDFRVAPELIATVSAYGAPILQRFWMLHQSPNFFRISGQLVSVGISPISAPPLLVGFFSRAMAKPRVSPGATLEGEDLSELLGQLLPNEVDEKREVGNDRRCHRRIILLISILIDYISYCTRYTKMIN